MFSRVIRISAVTCLALVASALVACGDDDPPPRTATNTRATATAALTPVPTAAAVNKPAYPPVAKQAAQNEYWGTKVDDDYQWLEDAKNPAVAKLSEAQNAFTRGYLDGTPARAKIRERVAELVGAPRPAVIVAVVRGDAWFLLRVEPPKQQPFLVVRKGAAGADKVVLDPAKFDTSGKTTIDMFVPSPDGKRVAISLSSGGSESGDVHVFDVATGAESKGDVVPRAYGGTAGGSLAWDEQGTGFSYSRYPRKGERPDADLDFYTQIYFHKLGTPSEKDVFEVGKDFPKIAEIVLTRSPDGKAMLAEVENGDGGEYMHLVKFNGRWREITRFADKWTHAVFDAKGTLYAISRATRASGSVVSLARPYERDEVLSGGYADPKGALVGIQAGQSTLFGLVQAGGPSELVYYDTTEVLSKRSPIGTPKMKAQKSFTPVKLPGSVVSVSGLTGDRGNAVLYRVEGYTIAGEWHRFDPKAKTEDSVLPWGKSSLVDMSDAEVTREQCASKDGTHVPMSVVHKHGVALDGTHPALLTGYGGYGLSRSPRFRSIVRLWLDHGGVYADANLRGGSEFGDDWHKAGALTNKQNVFDDFAACSDLLLERKYTSSAKLAIMGGSNGGLLMGAALTQHPEKYRAVVSMVGIYDMLRVENTPNGQFNITEFGTVKNHDQFNALYAYSPLHHVRDGAAYPAILFTTGENDPRVDPFHSRKMVSRLQAATGSDRPIMLRTSRDTGHGMGTPLSAEIEEDTDVFTFLFRELGVE